MSQPSPPLLNGVPVGYDRFGWVSDNIYGNVLDIGCKAGYIQKDKAEREITGLDLDQYAIPHYTKFVQGNAEKLSFDDKSFRCVVLAEALNYVADPVKVLMEAKRVSAESIIFTVSFEALWDPKNMPFQTKEMAAQAHNLSLEDQEKADTAGKLSGPTEAELPHLYPKKFFTCDSLMKLFDDCDMRYRMKLLQYNGFAFLCGIAWKK